jgi:hypothetical protein
MKKLFKINNIFVTISNMAIDNTYMCYHIEWGAGGFMAQASFLLCTHFLLRRQSL